MQRRGKEQKIFKNLIICLSVVAQACNPSHLGGRDQEDHGLRSSWAKSSQDPHLKQWLGALVLTCHHSHSKKHK
jgi:hypothetical protein